MSDKRRPVTGYAAVLRTPGLFALVALSGIGRLGLSATSLALILSIANRTGSFAVAGTGTAAFALASAGLAPVRGWLADRYGAALAIGLAGTVCGLSLLVIIPAHRLGIAGPVVICAVAGAVTPPLGALTKARMSVIFHSDDHARQLASSFDTIIDIAALVAGPSLAGLIVSAASADVALAASAALIAVGSIGTSVTAPVRRHRSPTPESAAPARPPWHLVNRPVMRQTVIAMCGAGAAIGAVEVVVPAFATDQHASGWSGVVLAILFGASSISGLLYGRVRWASTLTRRYRSLIICLTVSLIPLAFAPNVMVLAILVTLPGLAFGPTLISAFLLAQQSSAADEQTQANTWITTANTAGTALGLAAGGPIAAEVGFTLAWLSSVVLAAAGALAAACLTSRADTVDTQPRRVNS